MPGLLPERKHRNSIWQGFYLGFGRKLHPTEQPFTVLDEQGTERGGRPRRDGAPPKTGSKSSSKPLKEIEMKTSKIIAAAALSLLAAAGAQAETYEGVHPLVSSASRADVRTEAVVAARSENPYAEGVSSRVAPVLTDSADRAGVRAEAVAAAHSANPYAEGYAQGVTPVLASTVDRATVRAEARAAARGIDQLAL
jgi:hypothetical protein